MLRCAPGAQRTEHHRDKQTATAANNQWKQHCHDRAAVICLMGASEPDAVEDDFPNGHNKATAERDDEKRIDRSGCEANNAKGCLKRLFGATYNHQTNMENRGANKGAYDCEDRRQNNKGDGADARAHKPTETISVTKRHQ